MREAISIVVLVAFIAALLQFATTRLGGKPMRQYGMRRVFRIHKWIGYTTVVTLLLHPFLLVTPRLWVPGVGAMEAFRTMIGTTQTPGIVLGLVAWCLLFLLLVTSLLRHKMGLSNRIWRVFHGSLAALMAGLATWHAVDLGRCMGLGVSVLTIAIASACIFSLFWRYATKRRQPREVPNER